VSAFRISVYDKDRVFQCQIGSPSALSVTVRHNLISTLTMTVPLGHKELPKLMADGARLRVSFKGEFLMSGPIVADELETDGKSGSYTVSVEDDKRILWDIAGFPVPSASVWDQGTAEYCVYAGNAETIIKTAVIQNGVDRMGIPGLMVAPNLNRGAVVPGGVPLRMHPLADQMFPALEDAGIGVTVEQQGTALVMDVYEPVTHPRTLSTAGRTLKQVKMTRTRPKASRVIIGGPGEGVERAFRYLRDDAREAQYGIAAEVFKDVRDAKDDPDTGATIAGTMDIRGNETLVENGAKNGVAITLAGSGIFKYGPGGFHVGDRIPVRITDEITVVEVIRECTLKWVSRDYASIEPAIGELTDRPERVTAQRLAAIARGQRDQERR
jgi:hypothetical protein